MATDKLTEAHGRLIDAVKATATGENWLTYLAMAARLPTYSPNNVFLILRQRPTATQVAGYRAWQRLGRQVRKGEQGIAVLAPCIYRRPDNEPADAEMADGDERTKKVLGGFKVAHVFDVSQTDGDPLPERERPTLIHGDAPERLWQLLATQITAAGYELERGNCGSANGRTDFIARTVRVRDDVDEAQAAKTLAHELAHVLLHADTGNTGDARNRAEVEAESVAYLVCDATGLPTGAYSFPYVTSWAAGECATVRATATRVIDTARTITAQWTDRLCETATC